MPTMNVKDAGGATVAVEKPLVPGQAVMASSRPVVIASDQSAVPVSQSGTWTVQPGNTANTTAWKVDGSAVNQPVNIQLAGTAVTGGSGAIAAGTPRMCLATDSPGVVALGQAAMASSLPVVIASNQNGLSNRLISATFTTLTRPANTTAYTAGDSISDNATAGSVTALSATLSDVNDDPIFVSEILINSTDTGLAGKRIRAYVYNSDPTASSGVVGGDNAAFSNKKAGYIGSFSGVLESGFSDGTVGRLVPTYADGAAASTPHAMAGGYVVTKPTSGAKTLFIQYQAVDGFTPSANSTTIIGTARGWQGRAS